MDISSENANFSLSKQPNKSTQFHSRRMTTLMMRYSFAIVVYDCMVNRIGILEGKTRNFRHLTAIYGQSHPPLLDYRVLLTIDYWRQGGYLQRAGGTPNCLVILRRPGVRWDASTSFFELSPDIAGIRRFNPSVSQWGLGWL